MSLLLLNSSSPVERPFAYSWSINGVTEKALAYSWTIFQAVEKPFAYSWKIIAYVDKLLPYSWTIFQAIDKPLVYSWRIVRFYTSSMTLYNFRTRRRKRVFRRDPPRKDDF